MSAPTPEESIPHETLMKALTAAREAEFDAVGSLPFDDLLRAVIAAVRDDLVAQAVEDARRDEREQLIDWLETHADAVWAVESARRDGCPEYATSRLAARLRGGERDAS